MIDLDAKDLAAVAALVAALDAWSAAHHLYCTTGIEVWCDGSPIAVVGLSEIGGYALVDEPLSE